MDDALEWFVFQQVRAESNLESNGSRAEKAIFL